MADPVLEARSIWVRFGGVAAVADVSLALRPGEVLGLVGESGSGKTTLCRALLGLQPVSAGDVLLDGRPVRAWPARALRRRVQMLLQDAVSSLSPRMRVGALLREPVRAHRVPGGWDAMMALLHSLGLPDSILDAYPQQISGGQARRVAMARALILRPAVLIADEPTAGLDLSVQGDVLNLLVAQQAERTLAMLLVSHDLNVVRRVSGRVAVMYLGQIVEEAPAAALFAGPGHPYTAALLSTNPAIDPARRNKPVLLAGDPPSPAHPPDGCRFHTRCPAAEARCRTDAPALREAAAGHSVRCHFAFGAARWTLDAAG